MPTRQEIIDYITQAAQRRGIDPNTVLRVVQQESSFNPAAANDKTSREKSYGLFQLNVQGGLGAEARKRGIEPTDPSQWKQHVDFSLDTVKRDGWRQWGGARDKGIGRWDGVNSRSDTARSKSIDITDEPSLKTLNPPDTFKPLSPNPAASVATNVLRQTSPSEPEQVSEMARPSINDAIRQSMDEQFNRGRMQYAGFVPPGLTKGASGVRARASENVVPRAGMPTNERAPGVREGGAGTPYNRDDPSTRGMEGTYADYVRQQKALMDQYKAPEAAVGGAAPPPPPTPPGTNVVPSSAPQGGGGGAVAPATIRGTVDPNSGGPVPRTSSTTPAGRATTAAAATALGVASTGGGDNQRRIDEGHAAANRQPPPGANVDPGVAAFERQMNLPPGTLSNPNGGMAAAGVIPIMKEVMKDPAAAQAAGTLAKRVVQVKAQKDAMAADMRNDPTYYQQRAAMAQQQPGGGGGGDPIADRAMERAVMMDNAARTSARGVPAAPQQMRPPQTVPPQQTTKGTVSVRPTPPEQRAVEQQILQQNGVPVEKGDVPAPRNPNMGMRPVAASNPWPYDQPPSPEALRPSGPMQAPQMAPNVSPQMMDPTMMQLMQFFSGGGGNVG